MVSKTLFCTVSMFAILSCWADHGSSAEVALPEGSAPAAIVARHFPDRVHEFVWRNWNVVVPARLAKVVGASVQDIMAIAESMGLPPAGEIPKEMKSRGYVTLIRRNWHLLPYDQLLELVEMTPEQLDYALREDDMLWYKLGLLKPKCEPLRYHPPDEAARRRAAEIRRVVDADFGEELRRPAEPRFAFLRQFSKKSPCPLAADGQAVRAVLSSPAPQSDNEQIRFIYSYFAVYGDPLLNPERDPYPDGLLQRLSALGINGVWLHVILRDLAPGGAAFPEFGAGHEKRLANLRALVERAKKYGIGVYLYMNEPRAMPAAFFSGRKEMAGVQEGELVALCTSNPVVRQWMGDALAHLFGKVPDLGGVFTITASDNLTNCAVRGNWRACPHCKNRSDTDIIAEVNAVIEEGVHRSNPKAKVIVWDWGWRGHGDAPDIIARLPKSVWLMSVSEWALPLDRGGVRTSVGEYCMSAVGPGPRALRHWKLAREAGLKTVAKVQLNNSWELSTVPYLPVMDLVAEHCHNLAAAGVDGMMLSWALGGYPSPNLEIAARLRAKPTPSVDKVLDDLAAERYGAEGAPLARKAWTAFSTAFREYPYSCGLYENPVQVGPANPLYLEKTGYNAAMVNIPYDDVTRWRGAYTAEVFAAQFEKVAEGWRSGIADLRAAVEKVPPNLRVEARAELRFARAASIHFQSVANQTRFILARDALAKPSSALSPEEHRRLRDEIKRCLQSEIVLARQLFTLTREDSRIGFEASNQYVYLPLDLAEKVVNCRWLLSRFEE
jgi:hypothetical protein